ncbi:hypothetical protein BF9343_0055 [Bacteroides fragilis NCTC 9343]|uniref:Uncharacterized protein n=1 Tax=Bacteroides fragilis (strain ATCC 25285 / DSM 2151 / CCUG 4856 / JCM 11019 / LMG 10263 / NCTC 9343 / Onslow / VPI 2553 / EN-2) TaxID=272559 RepID=Q5LJ42_BACFN|nr:hypothetical protein BF9343_0055 [Bacteroides fragilis NCTC 9343]
MLRVCLIYFKNEIYVVFTFSMEEVALRKRDTTNKRITNHIKNM